MEVNEHGENHIALIDNNNVEPQSYFQDLGFDLEAMEKIMEMEDTWIIKRDIDYYLSWCRGNSNEINQ